MSEQKYPSMEYAKEIADALNLDVQDEVELALAFEVTKNAGKTEPINPIHRGALHKIKTFLDRCAPDQAPAARQAYAERALRIGV